MEMEGEKGNKEGRGMWRKMRVEVIMRGWGIGFSSGVFTALMWFFRAGENNKIQTQVVPNGYNKTPESTGVGWPSFSRTITRCCLFWTRHIAKKLMDTRGYRWVTN